MGTSANHAIAIRESPHAVVVNDVGNALADLDPDILEAVEEEGRRREAIRARLMGGDREWLSTANRRRAARRE